MSNSRDNIEFFTLSTDGSGTYLTLSYPTNLSDSSYQGVLPNFKLYICYSHNRLVYDHIGKTVTIKHLTDDDSDFPSVVLLMPDDYTLVIEQNANVTGLTIVSNHTTVVNTYGVVIDIVGRDRKSVV